MNAQNQGTHESLAARNLRQNLIDSPAFQRTNEMLGLAAQADDATARAILANVRAVLDIDAAFLRAAANSAMSEAIGSWGVQTIDALKLVLSQSSRSPSMPPHRLASFITAFAAELSKLEQS